MKWNELKKEWQESTKARKKELISYILLILSCTMLIILGGTQFLEYTDEMQSSVKYCIGGVFIASVGFWLFNYAYARQVSDKIDRLIGDKDETKG